MKIIISNTTEVGIRLSDESISDNPPASFPGKLLAFLFERFKAFNGSGESGMVIVPTELITDNGNKLKSVVLELAKRHNLDFKFIEWLGSHNSFCNSLVDRIVPGKPGVTELQNLEAVLGYKDELLILSEVFHLWAIEGDEKVKEVLSFAQVDSSVIIATDITLFKELKLRLLNGTHTFNCGAAFLSGFNSTRDAMNHPVYGLFTKKMMSQEIINAIPYESDIQKKTDFANSTFERFCNPFIDHQWQSITQQYTSKMKIRNIPLFLHHYKRSNKVPIRMATGFAGFLQYMKIVCKKDDKYFGERDGVTYEIKDDCAEYFYNIWQNKTAAKVAATVIADATLWETDLTKLPGFLEAVQKQLQQFAQHGVLKTVEQLEQLK